MEYESALRGRGRPLIGPSGKEFDRYLYDVGIKRKDVYVTNLVKSYAPGNADPTAGEVEQDKWVLMDEIERVRPEIIMTLGRHSTRFFLREVDMESVHGIPHRMTGESFTIMPIFHPAYGLHDTEAQAQIWDDFRQLGRLVRGEKLPQRIDDYPDAVYEHVGDSRPPIDWWSMPFRAKVSVDTEGYVQRPWGLSFCATPGIGLVIKVTDKVQMIAFKRWLSRVTPRSKITFHNALYDLAMLRAMGIELPDGGYDDNMVKAYLLRLEPQGLKNLAYRHCAMEMQSYDEVMGGADKRIALAYLGVACNLVWPPGQGRRQGVGQRIKRIIKDVAEGKPTSPRKRWENIDDELKVPVIEALDEMRKATLDDIPHDQAVRYSGRDADATDRVTPALDDRMTAMKLWPVYEMDMAIMPMVDRMQHVGIKLDIPALLEFGDHLLADLYAIQAKIYEMTGADINPNSPPQTAALLFDNLKMFPPGKFKFTKSGHLSTQDKILESMRGMHPVVPLICDYRERSKLRDSFALKLPRKASPDGRIRPHLRVTRVSSGRLAAHDPNLMAIPVRTELAMGIRAGFIAPEGRLLGDWDLNQIEMRVMADESQDTRLCGVFRDGRDVHAETAAWMHGRRVDTIAHDERYAAKRVGFGVITGITEKGLLEQMWLHGALSWTEAKCADAIKAWFDVYPDVRRFMDRKKAEARRYGMVRDRWGRIRYLPGVRSPLWYIREEALRQAHSHAIQAGAQGIMKKIMAKLWLHLARLPRLSLPQKDKCTQGWDAVWAVEPLLQIHDSMLMEFDEGLEGELDMSMVDIMQNTVELSIPITAKGKWGKKWSDCK